MDRLFAISDIHGCFTPFYKLIKEVIRPGKEDMIILLGDYIDRGDQSKEVIDFIIELVMEGYNVRPLAGNHEMMLINAYLNQDNLPLWMMNSGITTLMSFGIKEIKDIEEKYIKFFMDLPYYESVDDYLFVHAGFNDSAVDPFSDNYGMVWECYPVYHNPLLCDRTIIHGHRPKPVSYIKALIEKGSKVIPIDTGCVYNSYNEYGYLSALEVESMTLYSVSNR
jgi:serine/threonine protein phosphatase 1